MRIPYVSPQFFRVVPKITIILQLETWYRAKGSRPWSSFMTQIIEWSPYSRLCLSSTHPFGSGVWIWGLGHF